MNFDMEEDYLRQSVSNAINQFQPNYERALRSVLASLPSCDLRVGCEVLDRVEDNANIIVQYTDKKGEKKSLRTSWLVGADGKRGIVRKQFLEPHGIRQEVGLYNHVSTWIAANFEIALPSPATHPDYPLWQLGYSPEQIYELFWPAGFHFCNDTRRPAVSGRFGPIGSRFWRHEYAVEPEDDLEDPTYHLWTQFGSWLEIPGSRISPKLSGTTVVYPRDCIKVLRCRPFTFATKVVNRWYNERTILVGDAAHVFPPFGAQGIASGIRDAQALSWRLAFLSHLSVTRSIREKVLTGWAHERRQVCDHATRATKVNGSITNQRNATMAFFYRIVMRLLWCVPAVARKITRLTLADNFRYQACEGGFFLRNRGGGGKLSQIWIQGGKSEPELSDTVFIRDMARLSLIVVVRGDEDNHAGVEEFIEKGALPDGIFTEDNIIFLYLNNSDNTSDDREIPQQQYRPCKHADLVIQGITPLQGYDEMTLERQIGKETNYVIVRPDFYIHSVASDKKELLENVQEIRKYFGLKEEQ